MQEDCDALFSLFNATQGALWGNNSLWGEGPCCAWYGVECLSNRILVVDLSANNLNGSLPYGLAKLTSLHGLLLSENSLTGPLPLWIGMLTNLQVLMLNSNSLNGSIPSTISALTNLNTLYLQVNSLTGVIPDSIGNLSSLQTMSLRQNSISGEIPSSIGNLTNLNFLYLWSNQLSGRVPKSMGQLVRLQELELETNLLTGPFPAEMGEMTSLVNLLVYGNAFTGGIPSLGTLTNLETLYLSSTQLNGTIPEDLSLMTRLVVLVLADNKLVGKIPDSFSRLTRLQQLDLSMNDLSGEIPPNLTTLTDLALVYLQQNRLQGSIPDWQLPHLQHLNLSANLFSGGLLSSFSRMTMLETLDLSANSLSGPMRDATMFLPPSLVYVDLSHNRFQGSEHEWDISLPNIHAFIAANNDLSGQRLGSATFNNPAYVSLVSTSLTCPLPHFGNTTTVSVSQPLPCILDTTLLFVELYVLAGLASCYLAFLLLRSKCPQTKHNLLWIRLFVRCFLKFVSFLAMGRFLYVAFYNIEPFKASCHPVNKRPVFQPFLPMVFLCNHTEWPKPNASLSFPQFMSLICGPVPGCAGWDATDSRVVETVGAFSTFCSSIAGCTPVLDGDGWPSCEEGPTPDAWFSSFESVLALLWGFVIFIAVKEGLKVCLLIYARWKGKLYWEHYSTSSCWVVVILCCHPLLEHVAMRTASSCDLLGEFVYGAVLESLPLLVLTVYFYLFVVQTSLDALSTASLPLSLLNSCFILAKSLAACWWPAEKLTSRFSSVHDLTDRLHASLNSDDSPHR